MRHLVSFVVLGLAIGGVIGPTRTAFAAPLDAKAVQVLVKTFGFLSTKLPPDGRIVVIGGAADVPAIKAALATMKVQEGTPADTVGAQAIFVNTPEEARAARQTNNAVLTIGPDVSCVSAGACLLAVETQPKVVIYVSRAVAQASGVEFDPSFRMFLSEK